MIPSTLLFAPSRAARCLAVGMRLGGFCRCFHDSLPFLSTLNHTIVQRIVRAVSPKGRSSKESTTPLSVEWEKTMATQASDLVVAQHQLLGEVIREIVKHIPSSYF